MGHFFTAIHFSTFLKPHFWAQYDSWGSPKPKYEPGGESVAETPIVSKGLNLLFTGNITGLIHGTVSSHIRINNNQYKGFL